MTSRGAPESKGRVAPFSQYRSSGGKSSPAAALPPGRAIAHPAKHLFHVFPSFELGGVAIRISGIINHFGDRYRHTIVSLSSCLDCQVRIDPTIHVDYRTVKPSPYNLVSNIGVFRALTRKASPDLLLTYNWGSVEWALANSVSPICPNIHLESGFGPEEAEGQIARRVLFRRLALARASRIVVPSQTLVDIATRVWRVSRRKLTCIPNGVDLGRFAAAERGPLDGLTKLGPDALVIGTVAPLRREKNIARLLCAFARLGPPTDVVLVIVGDGAERAGLERLAGELGIAGRVVFTGHLENVERALPWFDIFALTSDTEQMPNSLVQAMAAGRAVAAVDVGDVKYILSPENRAFVAAKTDEAALVEILRHLLGDADLRRQLGHVNQERVRDRFTQEQMFDAYARVFDGVLT